jgi:uncharacterized protein (DUF433 family)
MAQHVGSIVRERMDEPHVAGHRVSVRRIHALVEERGVDPQAVADRLGLDIADVYRALAYYHDNPGEMHDIEQRREQRILESRAGEAPTGPGDV